MELCHFLRYASSGAGAGDALPPRWDAEPLPRGVRNGMQWVKQYGKTMENYGGENFLWDNGGKLMKMDCFLMFAAYSSSVKASSLSKI
jgi:hypothetical protein